MKTMFSKASGTAGYGQGYTACPNCSNKIGARTLKCPHCNTLTKKGGSVYGWAKAEKVKKEERKKSLEALPTVEVLEAELLATKNAASVSAQAAASHEEKVRLLEKQLVQAKSEEMKKHEKPLEYDETATPENLTYPKSFFAMLAALSRLTESGAVELKGSRLVINLDELA